MRSVARVSAEAIQLAGSGDVTHYPFHRCHRKRALKRIGLMAGVIARHRWPM